ncbi:MAG: S-layer homology domain-containing protein [Defluviitaleaceae bacterium]|nr:S-layer homology domain-containing protein [Defluviitaleaceae bacterium]
MLKKVTAILLSVAILSSLGSTTITANSYGHTAEIERAFGLRNGEEVDLSIDRRNPTEIHRLEGITFVLSPSLVVDTIYIRISSSNGTVFSASFVVGDRSFLTLIDWHIGQAQIPKNETLSIMVSRVFSDSWRDLYDLSVIEVYYVRIIDPAQVVDRPVIDRESPIINNNLPLKETITILSPAQSDYYTGFYVNHTGIGNSLWPFFFMDNSSPYGLASIQLVLPGFSGNPPTDRTSSTPTADLARSIVVSDFEITINGELVQNRIHQPNDLAPGSYLARIGGVRFGPVSHSTLSIVICEVFPGDTIHIKIPAGTLSLPGTNMRNTLTEFTFNVIEQEEAFRRYHQYFRNGERYPAIRPTPIDEYGLTPPIASTIIFRQFPDVPQNHWAYSGISELVGREILRGYPDGTFQPNNLVSRNEFAVMMTRAINISPATNTSQTFEDVASDNWAFSYVEAARRYLTGYELNGIYFFKGTENALREDMAAALVKALRLENQIVNLDDLKYTFSDYSSISPNMKRYVLIAYKNDLISGYPDGTFGARQPITRAEAASLLIRVINSDSMQRVTFE